MLRKFEQRAHDPGLDHLGREAESGRIVILHKIRQSDIAARAACRIHVVLSARWFLPFTSVS